MYTDNMTESDFKAVRQVGYGYPPRIVFWYWVHDRLSSLYHWVWRTRIKPYFDSTQRAAIHPIYREIARIAATPEEQARGITGKVIYRG